MGRHRNAAAGMIREHAKGAANDRPSVKAGPDSRTEYVDTLQVKFVCVNYEDQTPSRSVIKP